MALKGSHRQQNKEFLLYYHNKLADIKTPTKILWPYRTFWLNSFAHPCIYITLWWLTSNCTALHNCLRVNVKQNKWICMVGWSPNHTLKGNFQRLGTCVPARVSTVVPPQSCNTSIVKSIQTLVRQRVQTGIAKSRHWCGKADTGVAQHRQYVAKSTHTSVAQ